MSRGVQCKVHGVDNDPRVLSITPAQPGWTIATVDVSDGQVWTQPIACWALMQRPLATELQACPCTYAGVHAMIASSCGALEVVDEYVSRVVPPGWRATWHTEPNGHWILEPSNPDGEASSGLRIAGDAA